MQGVHMAGKITLINDSIVMVIFLADSSTFNHQGCSMCSAQDVWVEKILLHDSDQAYLDKKEIAITSIYLCLH